VNKKERCLCIIVITNPMLKKQAESLLYAAFQPAVTSFSDNNFLLITTFVSFLISAHLKAFQMGADL